MHNTEPTSGTSGRHAPRRAGAAWRLPVITQVVEQAQREAQLRTQEATIATEAKRQRASANGSRPASPITV